MNHNILQILIIGFSIFAGILCTIAWIPIIRDILCKKNTQKRIHKSFDAIQMQSFCNSLTPETIKALNSLEPKHH